MIFQIIFTVIPNMPWLFSMTLAKTTNFISIWKVSCKPHLIWRFFLDMIIVLHINTPWMKQYCHICCGPFSATLLISVQATIGIFIILQCLKAFQCVVLHGFHFKSSCFPQFCVQSYGRCIHRLHPYHTLHFDA